MIDDALLKLLRCPVTKRPLRRATAEEKTHAGLPPEQEALCTEDGTRIYGEFEGLPVLLPATNEEVSGG